MKIAITNTVALNGGDAAILFGVVQMVRDAFGQDVDLRIYDNQPEIAAKHYPNLTFRKLLFLQVHGGRSRSYAGRFIKALRRIRFNIGLLMFRSWTRAWSITLLGGEMFDDLSFYAEAQAVLSTGGTYLVENYSLESRIFDYEVTLQLGKPLVFLTQSLGPFQLESNRRKLKKIFDRADLILLRDARSLGHVRKLGVKNPNAHVCADAAFALARGNTGVLLPGQPRDRDRSLRPRVAISVREWGGFKRQTPADGMMHYLEVIGRCTEHLVTECNAEVTFISTCQGIAEYWADDSAVAFTLLEGIDPSARRMVRIDREFHDPAELIRILGGFDLVVSTRLHLGILALVAGVPVVPIAYEFKTQELFEALKHSHLVHDIDDLDLARLMESILGCLSWGERERHKLVTEVAAQTQDCWTAARLLRVFRPDVALRDAG